MIERARQLARREWGIEAEPIRLPGEYDDNFRLDAADGSTWVLKVMHPDRPGELIDLQCRALHHLAARAPGLDLPRVLPARNGELALRVEAEGRPRWAWLLRWVPGRVWAESGPHPPERLASAGRLLGQLDAALLDFDHPGAHRELKWDLGRAGWIREHLERLPGVRRRWVERFLALYDGEVAPRFSGLRRSVVHNDANDYNLVVDGDRLSLVDFGDMVRTATVCEPAIAAAYAVLHRPDPLAAAARLAAGYHAAFPLTEAEISLFFPLLCARLCVSVVNSALRRAQVPDDPYVVVSEAPAWEALERLAAIPPRFAGYTFRRACGLPPPPEVAPLADGLATARVFDLGAGSLWLGAEPRPAEAVVEAVYRELAGQVGVGRYGEPRVPEPLPEPPTAEHPTVHLGLDLFVAAGAEVRAPLAGTVHAVPERRLILRHDGFFTLYRGLVPSLAPGEPVAAGQSLGHAAGPLHFQVAYDLPEREADFPAFCRASERELWTARCPDPTVLLGIPAARFPAPEPDRQETLLARRALLGRNLSLSYEAPLKIVRGWRQYLYDDTGRAYLDVYNNVPLVGHSHPRVVRAIQAQAALLTTNTRYLHDNATRYAARLTALMPEPLRVCYFLSSASEANELALRLARAHTGRQGFIVLEAAYHGHTTSLIDLSPYKFDGPGGAGRRPWVHVAPLPDGYRGPYKRSDPEAGRKYAGSVASLLAASGGSVAGFLAETLPSVGGQIVLPSGYLAAVYRQVRADGGLCIADEVQVGFGRLGTHLWGFETQGVVPDIVVLGKPIGNGHPLAAVVTTPEIAASFDNGMEFFSTFGGNPVSCAAGLAVLDVLAEERLQENALRVGELLLSGLRALQEKHRPIGDVRGSGLFLGVELVRDRETLEPAAREAARLVARLKERGILAGTDGPLHNVIKLRPPLIFSAHDAALFLAAADASLAAAPASC